MTCMFNFSCMSGFCPLNASINYSALINQLISFPSAVKYFATEVTVRGTT